MMVIIFFQYVLTLYVLYEKNVLFFLFIIGVIFVTGTKSISLYSLSLLSLSSLSPLSVETSLTRDGLIRCFITGAKEKIYFYQGASDILCPNLVYQARDPLKQLSIDQYNLFKVLEQIMKIGLLPITVSVKKHRFRKCNVGVLNLFIDQQSNNTQVSKVSWRQFSHYLMSCSVYTVSNIFAHLKFILVRLFTSFMSSLFILPTFETQVFIYHRCVPFRAINPDLIFSHG